MQELVFGLLGKPAQSGVLTHTLKPCASTVNERRVAGGGARATRGTECGQISE